MRGVIFFKNKMAVRKATVAGTTGWLALKTRAVGTQLQNKKQTSHTQCRLGEGPSCLGGGVPGDIASHGVSYSRQPSHPPRV